MSRIGLRTVFLLPNHLATVLDSHDVGFVDESEYNAPFVWNEPGVQLLEKIKGQSFTTHNPLLSIFDYSEYGLYKKCVQ